MTSPHSSTTRALFFYRLLWIVLTPLLRFHKRMKIGYDDRVLKRALPRADLWIQAASVGEAYIVEEILLELSSANPLTILVTTNTSQGMDILKKITPANTNIILKLHYCPFDHPGLMKQAVTSVQPRLVVLIETELWPGFLSACKKHHIKVCVINGRMTEKSMKGYLRMINFWHDLAPDAILAMSETDRQRYGTVFGDKQTEIMANIKFDRLLRTTTTKTDQKNLSTIITPDTPFLILGSTRTEEEEIISKMIESLLRHNPDVIIGLFPRHMERISTWQQYLTKQNIPFQLRSTISSPVTGGIVILWNTIGELQQGYHRANSAFVGGSLIPLGGQNFLEPLCAGIQPVIGSSWSNFYWVGEEIFQQNLAIRVNNWQEAVNVLLKGLTQPTNHTVVQHKFKEYIQQQQGGTTTACTKIISLLQ